MINNEQANAMVNEFIAKVAEENKNKVIEFCNTTVTNEIKKKALEGGRYTNDVIVPKDIDLYMVLRHIQEQGFKVHETGVRRLWVQW